MRVKLSKLAQASEVMQGMLVEATPPAAPPDRPLSGWVLAASVLVAARLGRAASDAAAFDMAHLQVHCHQPAYLLTFLLPHMCQPMFQAFTEATAMQAAREDSRRILIATNRISILL